MKHAIAFHDCTRNELDRARVRIRVLVALHNDLWEEGDLVGAEHADALIQHLRAEIDFKRDSFVVPLYDTAAVEGMV